MGRIAFRDRRAGESSRLGPLFKESSLVSPRIKAPHAHQDRAQACLWALPTCFRPTPALTWHSPTHRRIPVLCLESACWADWNQEPERVYLRLDSYFESRALGQPFMVSSWTALTRLVVEPVCLSVQSKQLVHLLLSNCCQLGYFPRRASPVTPHSLGANK